MRARRCNALAILVIALCAGFTGQALAQNTTCPKGCDPLTPVNQEGSSSTDIVSAVKVTLDSMLGIIGKFGGPEVGGVAGSVQGLMDTGFSLWSAWSSVANPQTSIKNSLHNDMVKMQDYLVCEVDSIVNTATNTLETFMNQADMDTFNALVKNTIDRMHGKCAAMNCLNLTAVAPSQRNNVSGNDCVVANDDTECQNVQTWDPMKVTTCLGGTGVCDKGKCWTGFGRSDADGFFNDLLNNFNSANINNLDGLDKFGPDDVPALVVSAKMALMQINIYQQLIMLGSAQGSNGDLKSFAGAAAAKIGARYAHLTNITHIREMVNTYSTMQNSTWLGGGILNGGYPANWYSGDFSYDDASHNTATVRCNYVFGTYPAPGTAGSCWLWQLLYGNYKLAWGCDATKTKPLHQQTETLCYDSHGQKHAGPCGFSYMPYGFGRTDCNFDDVSWPTKGYCRLNSAFQAEWQQQHDVQLVKEFAAAKEALAQELLANMTTTLADVKDIMDKLNQLSQVGMPVESFGVFMSNYPVQKCDNTTGASKAAAAATSPVKLNSLPPLPKGAVLSAPTPATAAAMASPAPMAATMAPPAPMAADMASPAPLGVVAMAPPAPATPTTAAGNRKMLL